MKWTKICDNATHVGKTFSLADLDPLGSIFFILSFWEKNWPNNRDFTNPRLGNPGSTTDPITCKITQLKNFYKGVYSLWW